jgi:hypothetical protein
MNEATLTSVPPARRRRRLLWIGLVLLGLVAAGGAVLYVCYTAGARELREAVAEADRLDPGWRFENLEGARADVPDAENAARQVLTARRLVPASWLSAPPNPSGPELEERLAKLPPPTLLGGMDLEELRAALRAAAAAVDPARKVADLPRGRYAVTWAPDYIGTLMPHLQDVRTVARLLSLDAVRRAHDGDLAGALVSCRAVVNTGRSIGDEPTPVSQLARLFCQRRALMTLERVLAQGEAPAAELEAVQRLLEEEAKEPLQLTAARGERAAIHGHLEIVRAGQFDRAAYGMASSVLGSKGDDLRDRFRARGVHAVYLRYLTAVVEVAKLPPEEQHARWAQVPDPPEDVPVLLAALTRGPDPRKTATTFHTTLGQLRCASAAVAAERYRLEHGRWADTLDQLVPRYLQGVPTDPFDGRPLRLRRLGDGIAIYSVGPDRRDDGGKLDRAAPWAMNPDGGFQLWDVEHRRQRPPERP